MVELSRCLSRMPVPGSLSFFRLLAHLLCELQQLIRRIRDGCARLGRSHRAQYRSSENDTEFHHRVILIPSTLSQSNHCRIPSANAYRDLAAVHRNRLFPPDIFP